MGKIIDKVWDKFDYNDYINIRNAALICQLITFFGFCHDQDMSILVANMLFANLTSYLFNQDGSKTKDVKEVKELYDTFIDNYSKLNETFRLDNPIEIYEFFNQMLYNGLLSRDSIFISSTVDAKDIKLIGGANICNGVGVCRHISVLLSDILNKSGIESDTLLGRFKTLPLDISRQLIVKDLMPSYLPNHQIDVDIPIPYGRSNHMITVAKKDGYAYFLDSMNRCVFHPSDDKKLLINDSAVMKIKDKRYKINKYKGLKSTNTEDEYKVYSDMNKLVDHNMDIIYKFYKDNKDIYEEIHNKMHKMTRHR